MKARLAADAGRMRRARARAGADTSLVELIAEHFAGDRLARALDLDPAAVPRPGLERTLLRPAAEFLGRPSKCFRARLVRIGAALGGGRRPLPPLLPSVIELIHAGSLIVDDIQDDSTHRRSRPALHQLHGAPLALNVGNWLYFWPLELIGSLGLPAPIAVDVQQRTTRAMWRCHFGQALDLGLRIGRLRQRDVPVAVGAIAELKAGSLTELAASIGAVATGAPPANVRALARFGRRAGVGLQMLDDLANLRGAGDSEKRHEDLRLGRPTWVWAALARRLEPARFVALQRRARAVERGLRPAAPLAAKLRTLIGPEGEREPGTWLARARAELASGLGAHPELTALESEIARLEASYG